MSGQDMRKIMEKLNEVAPKKEKLDESIGSPFANDIRALAAKIEAVQAATEAEELVEIDETLEENMKPLDDFTDAYIESALWTSTSDSEYTIDNISPETLEKMIADCKTFQEQVWNELSDDPAAAGHDFWLTRNGHGAGFWDGDWPEPAATKLTELSKEFGEFDLYVGDDDMVHGSTL